MRIGIDVSQIVYGTGVGNYTRNLVEALLTIDQDNHYQLFGGSLRRAGEIKNFHGSRVYPISPLMADFLWNRLHILPIEKLVGQLDVFHSSDWSQPPSSAYKVTTIHDLTPIIFSDETNPRITATHQKRLNWVKEEVNTVIAVSESTKEDIIKYLGLPEKKIKVIYEAPEDIFQPERLSRIIAVKRKYKIDGNYILSVGTGKRKNLANIGRAMPKGLRHLVVGRGALEVPREDLPALYCGAQSLVYASLYEGFGLPILEAFACGCPVVTSNLSSMPEIAGDAAILVDPSDVSSIADGIKRARTEAGDLIEKGFTRVKKFTWENAARETLEVYVNRN